MRLYREFSTWNAAGVRTAVNPTAVTVATSTLAAVAIEAPAAVNDGAVGRYRCDSTDLLFTDGVDYLVAWTATIGGNTLTRTVRYRHCTVSTGVVPGSPTVGVSSTTDTTATFSNTLGTGATSTLITLIPLSGGTAITASGSGAFITATGLSPSTVYVWAAQGVNGATLSAITAGDLGTFSTARSLTIAEPLLVKFFVNGEDAQHINSPREIDIANEKGGFTVGDDRAPLGQGTVAVFLLENNFGNWWGMMDVTIRYREPEQAPFGIGSRSRDR